MSTSIDVELILVDIDEAYREWQQKFKIKKTTNEIMEAIMKLFCNCTKDLIELSIFNHDNEKIKQNQVNVECIVLKLKELKHSLAIF